ncbi:MAG: Asp23/Gls24 family envelope stress response protein [Clostridia bacterium]
MAFATHNSFGKLSIAKKAIAKVAAFSALDCYGVVELVSRSGRSNNVRTKERRQHKGVTVLTNENKINLHLYVVMKYGMSISAVAEAVRSTVKYKVEQFSCMLVGEVNIHVVGIGA